MSVKLNFLLFLITLGAILYKQRTNELNKNLFKGMMQKAMKTEKDNENPLIGVNIIITGSTSGIGKALASELYSLGGSITIASRNFTKCRQTMAEIKLEYPNSKGKLDAGQIDLSDLSSVRQFTNNYLNTHDHLNFLLNNAGIHYLGMGVMWSNDTLTSKQGYDLAFATNYLGHSLLTKLLTPLMIESAETSKLGYGRVINTASTYHYQADGSWLLPGEDMEGNVTPPLASLSTQTTQHRMKSYGNNKLANVVHAYALNKDLRGLGIQAIAVCPGWVNTNILPNDISGTVIRNGAHTPKTATAAFLGAMFSDEIKGGEFVSNHFSYPVTNFEGRTNFYQKLTNTGFRDKICDILGLYVLAVQRYTYGFNIVSSSPESNVRDLIDDLYLWTHAELIKKGFYH